MAKTAIAMWTCQRVRRVTSVGLTDVSDQCLLNVPPT